MANLMATVYELLNKQQLLEILALVYIITYDTMKRLFSISKSKGKPSKQTNTSNKQPSLLDATAHNVKPSLPAKFLATAVPHPNPFDQILVLASTEGLLLRPDIPHYETLVRISWGKDAKVEEINANSVKKIPDWSGAVVVYGIVGLVRLFTGQCSLNQLL
jgi:hypothetical protein